MLASGSAVKYRNWPQQAEELKELMQQRKIKRRSQLPIQTDAEEVKFLLQLRGYNNGGHGTKLQGDVSHETLRHSLQHSWHAIHFVVGQIQRFSAWLPIVFAEDPWTEVLGSCLK